MKGSTRLIAAFTTAICLQVPLHAHDPVDFRGTVWQWPADRVPVLDGNLAEWEILPAEFWITHEEGKPTESGGMSGRCLDQ